MIRAYRKFLCRSISKHYYERQIVLRSSSFSELRRLDFQSRSSSSGIRKFGTNDDSLSFNDTSHVNGIVDLMKEVAKQQQENIANIVPWFITNMPPEYFRNVSESTRVQQLKALTSMNDLGKHCS
jgi:hypothetical protein